MNTNNVNDILLDNISRCPECNLISSLSLHYKERIPYINYYCENNHKGNISLEEYMKKYNKYSLYKEKCSECNKNQNEINDDFFFCYKCNKFLCPSCIINHPSNDRHNLTKINRYDASCKIHYNYYCFYCNKCNKNLCIYCKNEHESHDIKDLIKFKNSYDINKIEEKIKSIKNKINNLEEIKNKIIYEIDEIKKLSELEIKYFNILLNSFKYEENQNNINYNIIENIKNFDDIFTITKFKIFDIINKETNKFISLLQSLGFQNCFKQLNTHTSAISQLSILKDGRLASCSGDSTLNIYKKDTFEIQLSIKEHNSWIYSFTQLNNDNIITCSADNTMNIIKLIDDNKYNLEQKLIGHSNYVSNVIEIRNNELISVSYDKTMKIWNINNNNKYECTNTINFQNNSYSWCNILKLNENEFVTSSYGDKCLKFWNSNNFTNISTINNIESYGWPKRNLCKLNDDILCVGGINSKGFYLIKISTHQLLTNITGPNYIYSIYKCFDGLFLCSIYENNNHSLVKYKYENQNLIKIIEKEKAHTSYIYTCIELNDEIIASGGSDNIIRLWRI